MPRESRSQLGGRDLGVGYTSLDFSSHDSSSFIIGTEGGAILMCSTNLKVYFIIIRKFSLMLRYFLFQDKTGNMVNGIDLKKCYSSFLPSHTGRVLKASFSPHHKYAIITAGSDNIIKVYSLMQVCVSYIFKGKWY